MSEIKNVKDLQEEIKVLLDDEGNTAGSEVKADEKVETKTVETKEDEVIETKANEAINTETEAAIMKPVSYSNTLIEEYEALDKIKWFGQTFIMDSSVQKVPVYLWGIKFHRFLENKNVPGLDVKNSKGWYADIELIARGVSAAVYLSAEAVRSWRIKLKEHVNKKMAEALIDTEEDIYLNGDTRNDDQNINSTGVAVIGDEAFLSADGLRKRAIADNMLIDGWVIDFDKILEAKAKLGKKWLKPQDLFIACDVDTYNKLLKLPEFKTVDTFGNDATVKAGVLGRIAGMDVKVVDIPLTNSDGVVDAADTTNNTKGTLLIVNKYGIIKGLYTNAEIYSQFIPIKKQYEFVCHANIALTILPEYVAGLKNIDLS